VVVLFQRFERNEAGRDYVVGDVHGCFDRLRRALNSAGFDARRDRLFSVGDLVDRGTQSKEAVQWLSLPWFHAVRGNHEQMAIEAEAGTLDPQLHAINGGLWFYELTDAERKEVARWFSELPYAIEVETADGTFGLVHAEVAGDDWQFLRKMLIDAETEKQSNFDHMERFVLWGRDIIRGRSNFTGVANIDRVYVGHTPVNDWRIIGNVHYIDTGAVFCRPLTLVCISDGATYQENAA
jgi:serine/threonine protein phosphatase 1